MSKLIFDWKDEDPGALIVMVLTLLILIYLPWHSCNPTEALTGKTPPQVSAKATP